MNVSRETANYVRAGYPSFLRFFALDEQFARVEMRLKLAQLREYLRTFLRFAAFLLYYYCFVGYPSLACEWVQEKCGTSRQNSSMSVCIPRDRKIEYCCLYAAILATT